jgi:hypothetical protein
LHFLLSALLQLKKTIVILALSGVEWGRTPAFAVAVVCSPSPNPGIVISTEAHHSLIVRRAVEKSAFAVAIAVVAAATTTAISRDPTAASTLTAQNS